MKEFYYFAGGVASLFVAQLIVNYNFSDWVKDKVLALVGKLFGKAKAAESDVQAAVKTEIANFKPKGKK